MTENPDVQVLVLEAGNNHDNDIRVQVPAFWTTLTGSDVDSKYGSVPQVNHQETYIHMLNTADICYEIGRLEWSIH